MRFLDSSIVRTLGDVLRDIRVWMQAVHLRGIYGAHGLNGFYIFVDQFERQKRVVFVKDETLGEDRVDEPRPGESVQQSLVVVVRDAAAVLHLGDHVTEIA